MKADLTIWLVRAIGLWELIQVSGEALTLPSKIVAHGESNTANE